MSELLPQAEARDMEPAPTMQPLVAKISKADWLPFPWEIARIEPRKEVAL